MENVGVVYPEREPMYALAYANSKNAYNMLREHGKRKEDARFVLPLGTQTTMVVTAPQVAFEHFLKLRLHKSAQWEIRNVAEKMNTLWRLNNEQNL